MIGLCCDECEAAAAAVEGLSEDSLFVAGGPKGVSTTLFQKMLRKSPKIKSCCATMYLVLKHRIHTRNRTSRYVGPLEPPAYYSKSCGHRLF